jgi:short-subunit dehydrogenase
MAKLNFENKWTLVTGASSGLGREIARYLAGREKANIIITARRTERLEELKKEIESAYDTRVEILSADLNCEKSIASLFERAVAISDIYAVFNNAGLSSYGKTDAAEIDLYEKIMNVNFRAVMKLSLLFLTYFIERGEGALLNVTSMGAFTPVPYQNVYAASKHAAQAFSEGLYREYGQYRKKGIIISTFAPGGIRTEMISNSGLAGKHPVDSPFNMKPEVAARKAVNALKKKKYVSIPGLTNKLTVFFMKHMPRRLVSRAAEFFYRPPK